MIITKDYCYSGIYCIINIKNGNKYIGSSKNITSRLSKHTALLRHNKHENAHLQNAWNKYGEEYFDFYVLEKCDVSLLTEREQFYISTLNPAYNITKEVVRLIMSDESRHKMSKTRKERMMTGEIKCYQSIEIHQYDLDGNYITSYPTIKEACQKVNVHFTSIKRYLDGLYKKGGGYLWSLTKVDKMEPYYRIKKDNSYFCKPVKVEYDNKTLLFNSIKECAEYFGVTQSCIQHTLKHSGIYRYKYKISFHTAVS